MLCVLVSCGINYFVTDTHLLAKLVWVMRSSKELSLITSAPIRSVRKSPVDVAYALQMLEGYPLRKKVLNIKDDLECF